MNRSHAAVAAFVATACGPIAMLAYQADLGRAWVPDRPQESIRFLNYRIPHAMAWFHGLAAVDIVWTIVFLAAVAYAPQLRTLLGRRFLLAVLGLQTIGLACMVASPFPMDSDQFAYVYYGDLALHGTNPYPAYATPLPLTSQTSRIAVHWDNPPYVDRYGPAWTLADAAALLPVVHAPAEVQARILRILAAATALACTLLLASVLPPVRQGRGLLAFSLNPLVLVAVGNGGHNDIFLLFFGLATWWLFLRKRYELAVAALATAACMKFAYAPLFPASIAYIYARSRSFLRATVASGVFAITVVAWSLPLGFMTSLIDPVIDWNAHHPPHISYYLWRGAVHLFRLHHTTIAPFATIIPALTVLCALAIAAFALRLRRVVTLEFALALLVLLLPYKLESWYAIMFVPLLLIQSRFALSAFLALSLAFQFLEMRIFLTDSNPYVLLFALGAVVFVLVDDFIAPDWQDTGTASRSSSVLRTFARTT